MKREIKTFLSIMVVLSVLLSTFVTAFAATSDSLNSNISWVLSDEGVLTISGVGAMPEYSADSPSPFSELSTIKKVVISSGVTNISDFLFSQCPNIKTVEISETVSSVGAAAFVGCTSLKAINVDENNKTYTSVDGVLYNKAQTILVRYPTAKYSDSYVIPYGVKKISDCAFMDCVNLASVKITNSVTKLGYGAFFNAVSLKSVVLSNNLSQISEVCFLECKNLEAVTIPDSVLYIAGNAFAECESLSSVDFGDSVSGIGSCAFQNCISLESVELPESVKAIAEESFIGCTSLINIDLPDGIESLDSSAFEKTAYYNDSNNWEDEALYINNHLVKVNQDFEGTFVVKAGTKTIANKAFYNCSGITSIDIPEELVVIGKSAFYRCINLEYITVPESLRALGEAAFCGCESLKAISIPDNIIAIERNTFNGCISLTSVTLGNGITTIAQHAFYNCKSLSSIKIPDSVKSLGIYSFINCENLVSVVMPKSVENIDEMAFYGCKNLQFVFYGGSQSDWNNISIGNSNTPLIAAFIHYNSVDHTFKTTDYSEATCTESGYINSECTVCGYSHYQYIPQNGHDFSTGWVIDVEPTESVSGEKSHHCLNCDERTDVTTINYNSTINDLIYIDSDGFLCNGEITYVVSVKSGVGVSGSVFAAVFDPSVLEPVEQKSGAYTIVDADGNEIPKYNGFYTSGLRYDTNDIFVIANTNFQETVRNKDTEYLKFTFKLKDADATNIAVDFYCLEFNGTQQIANNNFDVLASHSVNNVHIEEHTVPDEWVYDTVNLTKTGICSVCNEKCVEAILITDVLTFELNADASAYVVTDCINEYSGELVIPDTYENLPVTAIGEYAFDGCNEITSVAIPDSVTSIDDNSFENCDLLIIFCNQNSAAYNYAVNNNINWIADTNNTKFDLQTKVIYTDILGGDLCDIISCSDEIVLESNMVYQGTGTSVEVVVDGALHSQYILVVEGDTNGDSVCDVLDCFQVERASNGNGSLSGYYAEAGDLNCDGLIDITDYQSIVNKAVS